ncbi:MAG: cytochrome C [Proteobacteria bacterium]|nr:cytochrome C [Pseudomonadota bacterium]
MLIAAWAAAAPARTPVEIGESIYLRGILASGEPLQALREGGAAGARGAEAACVNCHQHSGLGSFHPTTGGLGARTSSVQIPPVAGRYLFEGVTPGHPKPDLPYVEGMRSNRAPYTLETLGRAIRGGIDADGHALGPLMPRFAIGDEDLASLVAYLRTIDPTHAPGVVENTLHFATIVTPDVEPARRKAMLDVMEAFFVERNLRQLKPSPQMHASGKTQYSRSMYMVNRQWKLHVWDLTGAPATWGAQLAQRFAKQPVFAVLSGLGRSQWRPVHDFCQQQHLACLFPNVEVPVDAPGDFYSLYLSRGVLLESGLVADAIRAPGSSAGAKRVQQIYRAGDSGEAAARALAARLGTRGVEVRSTPLPASGGNVAAAVRAGADADALVLWLRAGDLAAVGPAPGSPAAIYVSGTLGGLEKAPLPDSWRPRTRMAYTVDLPQARVVRVDYAMGWFRIHKIPVIDERMQADTYLVCGMLSEALKDVAGTFYGPYVIEELQATVEHRQLTGYYPHLSLAENQHFASKGGYLVRFAESSGTKLIADGEWMTP